MYKTGAKEIPMRQFFIVVFAFVLSVCNSAKDIGGMYHMISDDPALQRITLEIDGTRVSGQGPCNRYFGSITYSDTGSNSVQVGPIASTKKACPHLSAEQSYFQELQRVSMVKVVPGGLVLTTSDETKLVFKYR
jgi:heat shock protein HslJ